MFICVIFCQFKHLMIMTKSMQRWIKFSITFCSYCNVTLEPLTLFFLFLKKCFPIPLFVPQLKVVVVVLHKCFFEGKVLIKAAPSHNHHFYAKGKAIPSSGEGLSFITITCIGLSHLRLAVLCSFAIKSAGGRGTYRFVTAKFAKLSVKKGTFQLKIPLVVLFFKSLRCLLVLC